MQIQSKPNLFVKSVYHPVPLFFLTALFLVGIFVLAQHVPIAKAAEKPHWFMTSWDSINDDRHITTYSDGKNSMVCNEANETRNSLAVSCVLLPRN